MKRDISHFLSKYFSGIKIYIVCATCLALLMELSGLGVSYFISMSVDMVISNVEADRMIFLLAGIVGIILLNGVLLLAQVIVSENAGWKIKNKLRLQLLEKCTKLKADVSKRINSGEILELIEKDTTIIYSFFTEQLVTIIICVAVIIIILVILLTKNIIFGIYEILFSVFAGIVLYHFKEKNYFVREKARNEEAKLTGFEGEMYDATDDIRGNELSKNIMEQYAMKLRELLPIRMSSERTRWSTNIVMLVLRAIGVTTCLSISIYLLSHQMISLGMVYLFYQYTQYILYPLNILQQYLKEKQAIDVSITRIMELLNFEEEDLCGREKRNTLYDVEFKNVFFSYNKENMILKGINLYIPEGKIVGIGGRTGGGKTTLISLLLKLYLPNDGEILIGGENISEINVVFLRSKVLCVPQEVSLFHDSLRNNITLYQNSIPDQIIYDAISNLELKQWYEARFANGLDSILLDDGVELSAGEGQLISIIRAYIENPSIIIFDEITSKVDPYTENKIFNSLRTVMKGKTSIIISHNRKLDKFYDYYYELKEGELIGIEKVGKGNYFSQ